MATTPVESAGVHRSVSVSGARNLATTTKTVAQITSVTPRWLLRLLPWVSVQAGTFRVNRRKLLVPQETGVGFPTSEGQPVLSAKGLRHVPALRSLDDSLLEAMARRFTSKVYARDEIVVAENQPSDKLFIVAGGKVEVTRTGPHGEPLSVAILRGGDYFDSLGLDGTGGPFTAKALTSAQLFLLEKGPFEELLNEAPQFRATLQQRNGHANGKPRANEYGESDVTMITGRGNGKGPDVPGSYVDYEEQPREYTLTGVQSIVQIRTLIADLFNDPHDQLREQMRQAVESIKERQEWEIINNPEFGLLHNAARAMRIPTRSGAPTPDDMDDLLSVVWKKPAFFLAHPRAVAAFGRECTSRGVPPPTVQLFGSPFLTWRGVPIVPCDKLMVDDVSRTRRGNGTTNILLMRVGEKEQGVVGLHQPGIPSEHLPSLSVRFMGIDHNSIASYLISQYFSAAVLTPDAMGVLENVEVGYYHDHR